MKRPNYTIGPWVVARTLYAGKTIAFHVAGRPAGSTHPICEYAGNRVSDVQDNNANLIAAAPRLAEALNDMLAGWRYIRKQHGDLYGVGWDRCEQEARAALLEAGYTEE